MENMELHSDVCYAYIFYISSCDLGPQNIELNVSILFQKSKMHG